jgi:hypothetical protein
MHMKTPALLLLSLVVVASATVLADTKVQYKTTEGTGSSVNTILIGQGKMRAEADANTAVIIDPTAQTLLLIDHSKKTATAMTKADFDQVAQLIAQLDQMPPEMKQMMASRMGGAGQALTTADTGEKATVGGKSCRIFRTTQGTRTTQEVCYGDAAAFDVPAADRATLTASLNWLKGIMETFAKAPMMGQMMKGIPFRDGLVPLRMTSYDDKGAKTTSEFTGVSTAPIDAAMFGVPSGYKTEKMSMGGRGRGGN